MTDADTEEGGAPQPPAPVIRKRAGPSLVWLIPLITALVGGWLVYKTLSEQGPEITISFKTADGIEAGKTKIKYKNIDIGVVDSLRFSNDFANVIVHARMAKNTGFFLRRDTRFWVVKPRLGLRGVSGLSTLVSGAFIEIEPGKGAAQRHFIGLESPPVVKAEEAGRKVTLLSPRLGSIDAGSPVYYRGIDAGEVLGYELANDRRSVFIYAFIKAPFDELVHGNTRFWNVSGVNVSLNSEGLKVRTESIQSMLFGGIAFETPDTLQPVRDDISGLVFTLYPNHQAIEEQSFTQRIRFVLYFDGSVRGLNIGAPVEFKGIKVGTVTDIRLEFDSRNATFRIPVIIEIEPERVIARDGKEKVSPYQLLKTLVRRGLRARLQTGSLLTGQLYVELDMHPDTPVHMVNAGGPYPELPTIPASLEEITTSVKAILAKLRKLDLDGIAKELQGTLAGANRIVNSPELTGVVHGANRLVNAPELRASVRDLRTAMGSFRDILGKVDRRVDPLTANVDRAVSAGHDTLVKLQSTLALVNELLKSDSPMQYRIIQVADQLTETARSIRAFVDLLERNPDSVIFGKPPPGTK